MIMIKESDVAAIEGLLQEIIKDQVGFAGGSESEPARLLRRLEAARNGYREEAVGAVGQD